MHRSTGLILDDLCPRLIESIQRCPATICKTISLISKIISASPGSDVDLTSIIQLGNGVSMGKNLDSNFPVFNFDTGHNVVENALDVFENSLPSEFSIQVHLK